MVAPPLSLTGIPWKIPHFNGQKVGINNKRVIGLTEKPAPTLTRSKIDRPDDPFSINFFRRPAGRPDKKLSVHSPICLE